MLVAREGKTAMPFVNDETIRNDPKTIDRERDIVLDTAITSSPDGLQAFFLDWHGQRIYFEGTKSVTRRFRDEEGNPKLDLEWEISRIDIPAEFPETHKAVFAVITEALNEFGTFFRRTRVNSVTVEHTKLAFERYKTNSSWQEKLAPKGIQLNPEWRKDIFGDEA